jgi:hypothetical protein
MNSAPKHAIPHYGEAQHARPQSRGRRISRKWAAIGLIATAAAVLVPGVSYATASQPAAPAQISCRGVTQEILPAKGFITNPDRTQGAHLWWHPAGDGSACLGTVVEYVQYNVTTTKTWRVVVYDTQNPDGVTIASETFTVGAGWYLFPFRVRREFAGLSKVCVTATAAFGSSCHSF